MVKKNRFVIDPNSLKDRALNHAKETLRTVPFNTEPDAFDALMQTILVQLSRAYVMGYLARDKDSPA